MKIQFSTPKLIFAPRCRFLFAWAAFLVCVSSASADYVIHVLHPWLDSADRKDTLSMVGNYYAGYDLGDRMVNEGGGWFYYIYKTPLDKNQNHGFQVVSYVPTIYYAGAGALKYPATGTLNIDSLFAKFSPQTTEIWIYVDNPSKPAQVLDKPKKGKVIHLFNPWPDNSCQIIIGKLDPRHMIMREDLCGWYTFYYGAPLDSLGSVQFTDYFHTEKYTSQGLKTGAPIDLRPYLTNSDTVYILPQPFPIGEPVMTAAFPGKTGECGFRKVSAMFRDWKLDDISFFNNPTGMNGGGAEGMVQNKLTPPDYKPKKTTDKTVSTQYADSLNNWFKTITFPDGRTNDTCIDLLLTKGDDGRWTFDSDKMGGFFPLDSFNDPNNIKYLDRLDPKDPTGKMHNFHFTMEMHLQFVYHQGANLEFDFRGDDDVWIFVNNNLAIDLGGLHENASATLLLDKDRTKLGLVDGQTYTMDIFYCERNPVASNLLIKTSMDLHNSDELYYKEKSLGTGKTQYDIWQRIKIEGPDCGFTPLLNAETLATVIFILDGPGVVSEVMPSGIHYGGITVDANGSRVTLDSAKITGLLPGDYKITYQSTFDKERKGYLVFTVPPFPPDHLDIVTLSATLDPIRDQTPDSVVLEIDSESTQLYSVIRDKNGYYLNYGVNEKWTSRDTSVVTVARSPTDSSRCIVTKTGTGSTWIVVSDPKGKLKPDSISVRTVFKPRFPSITSAIMLDTNADIIPDMVAMTLSDTFKTDQRLDSVMLNYRGKVYAIPAAQITLKGTSLKVPFASLSGIDGRPSGQATLVGAIAGEVSRRTKEMTDGVGPALISADVLENESQGPDTLFLTFSEPVTSSTLYGKQLLLIKANVPSAIPLDIQSITAKINDSTFTVAIAATENHPLAGDSLRLLPGMQGGTIADSSQNTPHLLNKPVAIGFKAGPTAIIAAYYLDANADGFIDHVVMVFKRSVQPTDIKAIKAEWSGTGGGTGSVTVTAEAMAKIDSSAWSVLVDGKSLTLNLPRTGGLMNVSVEYSNFPGVLRSSTVADSAAPVIVSASLSYGNGAALDSTLSIGFSEPLNSAPGIRPFLLWSKRYLVQYQFRLKPVSFSNDSGQFLVEAIDVGNVPFAVQGDSIWIDPTAGIADKNGNTQNNPLNRREILTVILPQPIWNLTATANPFDPGKNGTEISVQSKAPIIDATRFTATLVIYDLIGNTVLSVDMPQKDKGFAFPWNGRYKNDRPIVSSGVYPAFIRISENGAEAWKKVLRIGIKR